MDFSSAFMLQSIHILTLSIFNDILDDSNKLNLGFFHDITDVFPILTHLRFNLLKPISEIWFFILFTHNFVHKVSFFVKIYLD